MHIFFFTYSLSSGGAERVTSNLANFWASKGWGVTIVTIAPKTLDFYELHPKIQRVTLNTGGNVNKRCHTVTNNIRNALSSNKILRHIRSILASRRVLEDFRHILALRKLLKGIQPDVSIAMMATSNILLTLASIGISQGIYIGSERTFPPKLPLGKLWERLRTFFYKRLDAVVALTEESACWLQAHTRAKLTPVIPNPILWPLVEHPPKLQWPDRLAKKHILLAVGRLSEEKQFDRLLRIFQRISDDFPDWMLIILGEGPNRPLLEAQVRASNLDDRVLLPGRAGNVSHWYERSDLYVMSSRFEGFPNTLAEALAHGLPAISFDCDTGPRDIIRHQVDGFLVPPNNDQAMEAALRTLMADQALRNTLSKRAIEARERFSIEKVAATWEALFTDLAAKKSKQSTH